MLDSIVSDFESIGNNKTTKICFICIRFKSFVDFCNFTGKIESNYNLGEESFCLKGVIFDLDGTLIDSMYLWEKADYALLKKYDCVPDEEYLAVIPTLTFEEGTKYIISKYKLNRTQEQIKKELWDLAYEQYAHHVELKQGAAEILEKFKKRNFKIAMATSSIPQMCEAVLKRYQLYDYFETIVFSEQIGKSKIEPHIYIETAKKIGLTPQQCYVFEDVPFAAQSAKKSGAKVIGIYDAYSAKEEKKMKEICDTYLYHFNEFSF